MKKYLLLLPLPLLMYFWWKREEQKEITPKTSAHTSVSTSGPEKSRKVFLSKRTRVAVAVTGPCEIAAMKLDDVDFNLSLEEWLKDLKSEEFTACQDEEVKERISLIQANCFEKKVKKEECFTNLIMFRSLMRARNIKDPTTRDELADLIMAEFSKKNPDFKKLKEFSGELLKQDPNDKPVQKVWAMTAVINGDPKNLSPELIDEIYQTLDPEEVKTDPELRSLDIILRTKLKPDSVEEYTRNLLESNPKDLSSREMLGWSLWQQGRRDEAIAEVDQILAQKNDPYLRTVRENLMKPDAKKESYPGRLSLGVKLEDLWN